MKLTNKSKYLINLFDKNKMIKKEKLTNETQNILNDFYLTLVQAFKFVQKININKYVSFNIEKIDNFRNIPKPVSFSPNSFPKEIRVNIETMSKSIFKYSLEIYDRIITILFITELTNPEMHIKTYNKYFKFMLVWLYIINEVSLEKCATELTIYIYHTSLLKELPSNNNDVLDEINVNTAFTSTCPVNSEIVIFRKEEWFKVFIHETMHNFGLDFSDLNINSCNEKILLLFNATSKVNLYESYAEFWARIINIMFCSFVSSDSFEIFKNKFEQIISAEIVYSCLQMIKVLNYMGLNYVSLISKKESKTLYKENTSVLSYYIITFVLIYSYQDFLLWCESNNSEILSFKKTQQNILDFCKFIKEKYKTNDLIQFIKMIQSSEITNKNKFMNNNLRMTLCELD